MQSAVGLRCRRRASGLDGWACRAGSVLLRPLLESKPSGRGAHPNAAWIVRVIASSGSFVLVDQSAENVAASDGAVFDRQSLRWDRLGKPQATVRSGLVVMANVLLEH
jgi:hypothetical protein